MTPAHPNTEACPLCPNQEIHRVHEEFDTFESRRTLRREKRIELLAGEILNAASRSAQKMDFDRAMKLAWELQKQVADDLKDAHTPL